jgi:hypothetical protein
MKFQYNDGGRAAAGFHGGKARDCVTRAISIAAEMPYNDVYYAINEACENERVKCGHRRSSARTGVAKSIYKNYLSKLGWKWTPTMHIGSGCQVHLRDGELPMGRLIVSVSRHMVAVIDGVIHDTYEESRGGTRCVYGYWSRA